MTDDLQHKSADVTTEACAWIAQLETGALSSRDAEAFREWIGRSPRHYAEIHRLATLSGEVNVLVGMAAPLKEAADSMRPIRWSQRAPFAAVRKAVMAMGVAMGVAVIAVGAVVMTQGQWRDPVPYMLATQIGDLNEAELRDKSRVKLNTNSQLEVDYDRDERRVRLLEGEAYFEVAHDQRKPFVVYAGDQTVRAVGTAFTVRYENDKLSVVVTQGRVALGQAAASTDAGREDTLLSAGQQANIAPDAPGPVIAQITDKQMQRALSWRAGLLDFDQAPLATVVAEFSRYTPLQIEIADDELRDLRFGGLFRIGETQAFFDALELSFGVEVEYVSATHVLLTRRPG